ncbi:hypothetical protein [Mycolicibacterium iranicum]|uniref:Mitomycin antibiotics/polyketide fumonisin biosynthesis protein n=1 Tax=Mycolicibacterium iranicum TaxID=912594 RepID=A0A178LHJ3_MYCIR|nr:hypothetical protein [Mycolicibacterium iranicum]OAN30205.1 mitomycin antibiotics/polyketide fumonisin biosynthesis protein [Mycolicibacterium iranicum]
MVDVGAFVGDGFVKIPGAAPRGVADAARALLWKRMEASPDDPATWTQPVVWTADMTGEGPLGEIACSTMLFEALDKICGDGGWVPRGSLGNIPVRFPVEPAADDRGWHIDLNTQLPDGTWVVSRRPQTLLLLTLLSEVTPADAPTRVRAGSHRRVAAALGDRTYEAVEAGALVDRVSVDCPVRYATGVPGDMYVLHPFTVHAADEHRGSTPRFMAQAPIMLADPARFMTPGVA